MVTGLSQNRKADTDVLILDLSARNSLSDMIKSYEEKGKKISIDCFFKKKAIYLT